MVKVWLKRIGAVLANVLILYVLLNELLSAPTYSAREVDTAIAMAVENAQGGRLDAALQQLEALTELAGEYPQVWYNYLTVLSWDDQKDKATKLLENIEVSQAPEYFLTEMIDAALAEERYDLVPKLAAAAMINTDDPEQVGTALISHLLQKEQFKVAANIARQYSQRFPENGQLQLLLAQALADDDPVQSAATLEKLLAQNPANEEARALWATHLVQFARQGELDATVQDFTQFYQQNADAKAIAGELLVLQNWDENDERVMALWPELEDQAAEHVKAAAAQSFRRSGQPAKARQLYGELLQLDPDNPDYLMGAAWSDLALDNASDAADHLDKITGDQITPVDLLEAQALAAAAKGDHQAALGHYQRLLELQPESQKPYTAWFDQAALLTQQQGWATAEPHFSQVLPSAPLHIKVETAALLLKENQPTAANKLINSLPLQQVSADQLENLAKLSRDQGQHKTAETLYQAALSQRPEDFQLRLGQALVNVDRGDSQTAWRQLETIEDQYPNNPQLLEALVYFHRRFDNHDQVARYLERLAESSESPAPYLRSWGELKLSRQDTVPVADLIDEFESMLMRFPYSEPLRHDTIALMHRVGYYEQALETGEKTALNKAPAYVLEALGQSARELQQYQQAQEFFRLGTKRFPDQGLFPISYALVLVDQDQPQDALSWLADFRPKFGNSRDFLLAEAYAYEQNQQYLPALANYQTLINDYPEDDSIYRSWVMAMNYSGAPRLAIEKAKQRPEIFRQADWRRLHADHAAIAVREGSFDDLEPSDRRRRAEQALALIHEYQAYLEDHFPGDEAAKQQAEYDEILALHSAGQFDQTIAAYEQQPEPLASPSYVLKVVGDTYLRLNQARQAKPVLERALTNTPDDHTSHMLLFYAQVETEHYQDAEQTIQRAIDNQPIWRRNGKVIRDNPKRLAAERVGNLLTAYRNRLDQAQAQLEEWLAFAPSNTSLRGDLARIYRWRGWPEKSLEQYQLIETVAPDDFQLQLGSAQSLMDLRDYPAVDEKRQALLTDYPEDTGVIALEKSWQHYQDREFISRVRRGFGDNDFEGGDDLTWETWLYDQPYGYHWRPFLHHRYSRADFAEGTGRVERLGAGIEYREKEWLAQLEIHEGLRGFGDTGARLDVTHFLNDHWQLSGELQHISDLVPVRAYNADVDGDSLALSGQYRWHESRRTNASLQAVDFSDDNRRLALSLNHNHVLLQNERHRLSLTESAYASKNSEQDTAYFNPERDFALGLAVEYEGLLNRYYDNQLSHRVLAGLGNYQQKSFGNDYTWDLEYEQRWQRSKAFSVNYGANLGRRVYDGESELLRSIFAGVNWRF